MLEDKTKGWDLWTAVIITLLVILVGILCILLSGSWEGYKQLCALYCQEKGGQAIVTLGVPMECKCVGINLENLNIPVIWRGGGT